MREALDDVREQMLDHRVRAASVGPEQQREDVTGLRAGRRGAERGTGAGPVHPLQLGHVVRHRVAIHRQRQRAAGRDQIVDARVEHRVVDHVGLAGQQHHRIAVLARPGESALADLAQPALVAALARQSRVVGGAEDGAGGAGGSGHAARAGRQSPRRALQGLLEARRVEVVALALEEDRAQHVLGRALRLQRARHHVGCALSHGAGVGHRAGIRQRQMHEQRRDEHVDVGAGQAVQHLDGGAGAGGGATAVALGQRARTRAQHLDLVAEPAKERMEERQRVDDVVRVGQAETRAGVAGGAVRRRPVPQRLLQQGLDQLVALAIRAGRILGQLVAASRRVVVLGALPAAHDLRALAVQVDLRELQPAHVVAVTVFALELPAPGHPRRQDPSHVEWPRGGRTAPAGDRGRGGLGGQQGDAHGAHRSGVGGHEDLALQYCSEGTRQRRVRGRLALEEDPAQ